MLFPLAYKACDWLKEEFMLPKLHKNAHSNKLNVLLITFS